MTEDLPMPLGKFIRLLRTTYYTQRTGDRKLTQEALGERIGYNRELVNRWENDKAKPSPDAILRIAQATCASPDDIHYMLGLAGHLPITRFPRLETTLNLLRQVAQYVARLPYPAYVLDYRGRYWIINEKMSEAIGVPLQLLRAFLESRISNGIFTPIDFLEVVFNSRLPFYHVLRNREQLMQAQVVRFKLICFHRRHEPFYQNYLSQMQQRLSPEDYQVFHDVWHTATPERTSLSEDSIRPVVTFERNGVQRTYNLVAEPIISMFERFHTVNYLPRDALTSMQDAQPQDVLCLWHILDREDILRSFPDEFAP